MTKVLIFHYSDFAMWLHIEVTEQSNCETTVPESDILVKKKHRGTSVSFKTVQDCVDFDFYSLSFLKLCCRTHIKSRQLYIRKTNSG